MQTPDSPALVLVNLGTPAAPTAQAVHIYLSEFLMDRRVVQIPRLLWWPLLHWIILPRRSPVVAEKYATIWMEDGSPLAAFSQRLVKQVQSRLAGWRVALAMRYGAPALAQVLDELVANGHSRIVVLPLYPQYSTTTTASVEDVVADARARHSGARFDVISEYHVNVGWVAAVADSIHAHWARHGRGEKLVLSFHGIPERLVRGGDPYAVQCEASTRAIVAALGVPAEDVLMTFQSRFGRERWLQPYTQPTLEALARAGTKRIDVACPGFAVDCLETLEEIAEMNAEAFVHAGGEALSYIPCLNDAPMHADALAEIARAMWAAAEARA